MMVDLILIVKSVYLLKHFFFLQSITHIISFNKIELIQDGIESKTW